MPAKTSGRSPCNYVDPGSLVMTGNSRRTARQPGKCILYLNRDSKFLSHVSEHSLVGKTFILDYCYNKAMYCHWTGGCPTNTISQSYSAGGIGYPSSTFIADDTDHPIVDRKISTSNTPPFRITGDHIHEFAEHRGLSPSKT